jgi:hypothetical protein
MKHFSVLHTISALAILTLLSGCTIIGGLVGSAAGGSASIKPERLTNVRTGTQLRIALHDGGRIDGRLAGLKEVDPGVYGLAYAADRQEGWPSPGDSVALTMRSGKVISGTLQRYRPGLMIMREGEYERSRELAHTSALDYGHGPIPSEVLMRAMSAGRIPYDLSVVVDTRSGQVPVDLQRVARVTTPSGVAVMLGIASGFVLDLVIIREVSAGRFFAVR